MKKNYVIIFILLLIVPFGVFAATDPMVLSVSAEGSGSSVNYAGTTEDGVYAVMCKLFNSSDEEVDKLSSSVSSNAFSGSFTNVSDGNYTVVCARYEGGEVKKASVTLGNPGSQSTSNSSEEQTTGSTSSNPKTYDAGIGVSTIILAISVAGIVGSVIYLKKIKN